MRRIYAIFRYLLSIIRSFIDYLSCSDEELSEEFFKPETQEMPKPFGSFSNSGTIVELMAQPVIYNELQEEEEIERQEHYFVHAFMNDLIPNIVPVRAKIYDKDEGNFSLEPKKYHDEEKSKNWICKSYFENYYYVLAYAKFWQQRREEVEQMMQESSSALYDDQKTPVPEINMDYIKECYEELKATYFMNFSCSPVMALLPQYEEQNLESISAETEPEISHYYSFYDTKA